MARDREPIARSYRYGVRMTLGATIAIILDTYYRVLPGMGAVAAGARKRLAEVRLQRSGSDHASEPLEFIWICRKLVTGPGLEPETP